MTFLPIVERELRLAARKRLTFWLRVVAALVAMMIGGGFLLLTLVPMGGRMQLGGALFAMLTWMSLAAVLSAGIFFTSDCLSEEKREGTLGFLFLTDLRGYDVVLGKLLATSLRCVFGLLAIFPILAITQLMGGVEAGQFWRTLLALLHALFFSLAAGMFVSAVSRNSQKAMSATLVLLVIFLAGGPAVDGSVAAANGHSFQPLFSLSSPGYVFASTNIWVGTFWEALIVSQVVAWGMLLSACWLIPRTWQDRTAKSSVAAMRWRYWWKYGGGNRRARLRKKLLDLNPVMWLASRERWQWVTLWIVAVSMFGGLAAMFWFEADQGAWMGWVFFTALIVLLFYLWMASQACQFFADARRTGMIELLLAAPLAGRQIVLGPWRALLNMFLLPVVILLVVQLFSAFKTPFGVGMMSMGGVAPLTAWAFALINAVAAGIVTVANLIALAWFGLWMGLSSRSARSAVLKTLLFVQIVPWFLMTFAAGMVMPLLMIPTFTSGGTVTPNNLLVWYPILSVAITTVLSLGKDFFFWNWSRRKLFRDFREMAANATSPIRMNLAPPVMGKT